MTTIIAGTITKTEEPNNSCDHTRNISFCPSSARPSLHMPVGPDRRPDKRRSRHIRQGAFAMIFGHQQKSQYIPTLDGWRAVAILGVIVCHTAEYFVSEKGLYPSARLYAYMFHGRAGVSVFFCLSGFLICTLLLNEYQASGTISLRGFY